MVYESPVESEALAFVTKNRKALIARFASPDMYKSARKPVSLFMAGTPGAGKTEVSKSLLKEFKDVPVRIDADEIRPLCPGYTGSNAHLFQKAANKGVNILYDHVLNRDLNCVLDGTFAYAGAVENIERSLKRNRSVEIWFVYQAPLRAWEFTKAREAREARRVSKDVFVKSYFDSRRNTTVVKNRFGRAVRLNLLVKDYEEGNEDLYLNIGAEELDRRTDGRYSEEELKKILL